MKKFILILMLLTFKVWAWAPAEVIVSQTAGSQIIPDAKWTRITFNSVEVNVDSAWKADTQQWCPGVTGTAIIDAEVLFVDTSSGGPLPDKGITEIFIMRYVGQTPNATDYIGTDMVTLPYKANIMAFSGSGNQSNSIHKKIYVDNAAYCYSITLFQWTGFDFRITNSWPQVTDASFMMGP